MAGDDLTRGVYSGQFAFVYIEPKSNAGRYDQEVFHASHEWEPYFLEGEEEGGPMSRQEVLGETDWEPPFVEVDTAFAPSTERLAATENPSA